MENDRDVLNAVVEAFLEEVPQLLGALDEAIEAGDKTAAERAAHTLKGNFRILQFQEHQELCAGAEALAREGRLEEVRETASHVRSISQESLQQLARYLETEAEQ
jgi:HPt (histidine-containing phosphotransfer) domain-containing protein